MGVQGFSGSLVHRWGLVYKAGHYKSEILNNFLGSFPKIF